MQLGTHVKVMTGEHAGLRGEIVALGLRDGRAVVTLETRGGERVEIVGAELKIVRAP